MFYNVILVEGVRSRRKWDGLRDRSKVGIQAPALHEERNRMGVARRGRSRDERFCERCEASDTDPFAQNAKEWGTPIHFIEIVVKGGPPF